MKSLVCEPPFKLILVIGLSLGILYGGFSVVAQEMPEGMECRTQVPGCLINGCRRASLQPDSAWVCNYSGDDCPPLTACS